MTPFLRPSTAAATSRFVTGRGVTGLLVAVLALAGCASASERLNGPEPTATARATPTDSSAEMTVIPATGATQVAPDEPVVVTAAGGKIEEVRLTGPDGEVTGRLDPNGVTWTSTDLLGVAASYSLRAVAVDPYGLERTMTSTFTTLAPTEEQAVRARVSPLDGETVGVGMPVVLYLTAPVEDRAAVEERLTVTTEPAVEGAWHWISDEQVHWRPKEFWPPGTQVSVDIPLAGVRAGETLWGDQDRTIAFSIAEHAVTSLVDLGAKTMQVSQDGQLLRTLPISAGKPGWETRNGIKVILSKERDRVMDAATVGIDPSDPEYYRLDVEYAMRVTNSGEFVHAAPWSTGSQGEVNVSHGCVGLSTEDAAWLYDLTTRGDVVRVIGSPRTLEPGNGYTDWNVEWADWLAGSALADPGPTAPAPTT